MIARTKQYVLAAALAAILIASAPASALPPFISIFDECDPVLVLGDFLSLHGQTNLSALVKDPNCNPIPGANLVFTGVNLYGIYQGAGNPDPSHPNAILTNLFGIVSRAVNWPPDIYKVTAEAFLPPTPSPGPIESANGNDHMISEPVVVTIASPWDNGIFVGGAIKEWCWGSFPNVQCGLDPRRVTVGFQYVLPWWMCKMLDDESEAATEGSKPPKREFEICFNLPRGKHEGLLVEDPDNPLGPIEFSAKQLDNICFKLVLKSGGIVILGTIRKS